MQQAADHLLVLQLVGHGLPGLCTAVPTYVDAEKILWLPLFPLLAAMLLLSATLRRLFSAAYTLLLPLPLLLVLLAYPALEMGQRVWLTRQRENFYDPTATSRLSLFACTEQWVAFCSLRPEHHE
jgi:hypothetical protein